MSKKTIVILAGVALLVLLGLGITLLVMSALYRAPINRPLELDVTQATVAPSPLLLATATPVRAKICGNNGDLLILLVGSDFNPGEPPLGADTVRLARVDFDNQRVDILALPRDLLVSVEGKAPENQGRQPLGLSYYYEREATAGSNTDRVELATNFLAQTVLVNYGFVSEHYLTVQLKSLAAMVDAVGGVEITLPAQFTTRDEISFPAGVQTLDGEQAVIFVRAYEGGDDARRQRQDLFLEGLQRKLFSTAVLNRVPELLKQFEDAIVTDLSPQLLNDLACLANRVPSEEVNFHEIPADMLVTTPEGELMVDEAALRTFIVDLFDLP